MNNLNKILKNYVKVQTTPSVPFLTSPQIQLISQLTNEKEYEYVNNNYSLIVNYPKNPGSQKLIVMCHTDHPGMILKNNTEGILMGSVGLERLEKILKEKPISLKIFSPQGKYQGKGKIISLSKKDKRIANIETNIDVSKNSFAQYDMEYFGETKEKVSAYNADNGISVATMYTLLEEGRLMSNYDVYFVFNLHEEVHQVSSWHLAKNNILNIKNTDLILNLECLKVENVDKKLSNADYNKGLVLQLSNTGCLFGYKSNEENYSEQLVKYVAKKNNIKIQTGIIKDSCDSRPFSYFDLTPNIVTLTVPNKHKHNEDETGNIVAEEIYKKDIEDFYSLTKLLIKSKVESSIVKREKSISKEIKTSDTVTDTKLMSKKAKLNERLEKYYKYIVSRHYFYPENFGDNIMDTIARINLYVSLFLQKIT